MKNLTIRVEDEFHKKLKYKMIEDGTTVQTYVLKLILKDLELNKSKKLEKDLEKE